MNNIQLILFLSIIASEQKDFQSHWLFTKLQFTKHWLWGYSYHNCESSTKELIGRRFFRFPRFQLNHLSHYLCTYIILTYIYFYGIILKYILFPVASFLSFEKTVTIYENVMIVIHLAHVAGDKYCYFRKNHALEFWIKQ